MVCQILQYLKHHYSIKWSWTLKLKLVFESLYNALSNPKAILIKRIKNGVLENLFPKLEHYWGYNLVTQKKKVEIWHEKRFSSGKVTQNNGHVTFLNKNYNNLDDMWHKW